MRRTQDMAVMAAAVVGALTLAGCSGGGDGRAEVRDDLRQVHAFAELDDDALDQVIDAACAALDSARELVDDQDAARLIADATHRQGVPVEDAVLVAGTLADYC